jgi:hypothetical protein
VVQVAQIHLLHSSLARARALVLAQVLELELVRELHRAKTLAHSNHPTRSPASLVPEHKEAKINQTHSHQLRNK